MQHINFGMVADMSTRKVTSVHLEDMMNEDRNTMHSQIKTNVDKYNKSLIPSKLPMKLVSVVTKFKIWVNGYEYKWDRVLSFEGDTGPHLQCQDQQTALARLWLYRSCGDILANAMKLLTLDPLDRM
ncbi:hypothetical protein PSHT_16146 [Puccinia striiformis]|uniref:Uncharacterized protein n=1 Tax=Puccinia striiformis TaxID=27350 RepID=A0A2S4UB99_9BASI|nr:hypothetical protein PSHT_16146 [Puccinia striiformis]